jgi:hypothetical protein
MLIVLVLADGLGRQTLDERGIQADEGGEQDPQLDHAECGLGVLSDADERGDATLDSWRIQGGVRGGNGPAVRMASYKKGAAERNSLKGFNWRRSFYLVTVSLERWCDP